MKYGALFLILILLISCHKPEAKITSLPALLAVTTKTFGDGLNFIIVSDWGWNGFLHQQEVAIQMAKTADSIDAEFIVTCGDNFQINGIASTQDPLWLSSFENVYRDPSLLVNWYPVLGNHDYKGSPQAEIDYSKISRRWRLTDHYYTFARHVNDSISVRFVFLDTPPLIEEYHQNPEEYPEIVKQDSTKQIKWLQKVLEGSKEQWILVFGHHPVYSASLKHGNTPDLIHRIKPLLEKYHAQMYFCGHDHDFQHLKENGGKIEYIVTGTGGETRVNSKNEMTLFSGSEPGFSVVSLKADSLRLCFVGLQGKIIYSFGRINR
jgi:tartrate-resistant acid phosphatase type 5